MNEPRWLDPTQQRAWKGLLVFIHRGMPVIDRTLKEFGLLGVHYSVLVALSDADNHTLGLSQLADGSNLSQSRLTHRMRTLVERGFVSIEPDSLDRRAKNATLTDDGFAWLKTVAPRHVEDVQRIIFDHLDPTETKLLGDALAKVAAGLCDHEQFQLPAKVL